MTEAGKTGRLFFGIELPEPVKRSVAALLPRKARGLRMTRLENLHITLRFVGEVDAEAMDRVRAQLEPLQIERFTLPLEKGGRFPPRGTMRVVWLGIGAGHPRLFQVRKEIDDTLLRNGVDCELRDFVPHLTLARVEPSGQGAAQSLLREVAEFEGPVISVDAVCLFESKLGPDGPRYEVAQRFPLGDT